MRAVVLLILGGVFACYMITALLSGRVPRDGIFVRNLDGRLEWTRIYRSELPWAYWTRVISFGLTACLLFVFALVPWTVLRPVVHAVPKMFPWFLLLGSVWCVHHMIAALATGKARGGWPKRGGNSWVYYTYRSDSPIGYWILVASMGFFAILGALGWWFVPRT